MLRTLASTLIMFYSNRIRSLVAMAAYIFHGLIIGKVKIDIFLFSGFNWDIGIYFTEMFIE